MAGDSRIVLVLLGPPGSGKGTQAKLLSDNFNLVHISTGDLLRREVAQGTDLGKKAKIIMEKGELVPDSLVNSMLKGEIKRQDSKNGFIFDGYPRNLKQAAQLDNILKQNKLDLSWVIYFKASLNVIIQRLSGRRVCEACGANYHITNMPPKVAGRCDLCNEELIQRKDDSKDSVRKRIEVYDEQTKDLVSFYEKQLKLRVVSGDLSAQEVFKEIDKILKK
ncbi:MAG: adenylate kinase [Candidatus Omnitrophota bacterium]